MLPWQIRYGRNTLKRGMTGSYVVALQEDLGKAGFPVPDIDGIFGGDTETAVYNFQVASQHLETDGEAGSATKQALYSAVYG